MFLTDSKEDADKVRKWSTQSREGAPWYQHEELGYNYRMSNIVAGVVRGQLPYLEEHIAQKKAIYERYKEGLKDLPVKMNPYDAENSEPNFWLSCITIEPEAMCRQELIGCEFKYMPEHGKSCPMEILNAIASINAEGRPIWKPMHLQPTYKRHEFVTRFGKINSCGGSDGSIGCISVDSNKLGADGMQADVGMDIFCRGLCLPSDNKMTAGVQDRIIEIVRDCFR
jgi:dTDP-4-amino-4,6-dideoxygalactose transaminase